MMDLTEALFHQLCDSVLGTRVLQRGDRTIDLGQPFRRISYNDALRELVFTARRRSSGQAKAVSLASTRKTSPITTAF